MKKRGKGSSDKRDRFESLEEEYRVLSRRADKRLQRLEKYSERPGLKNILKGAYARAMKDIEAWRGKGRKRFGDRPPEDPDILRAELNDIRAFLRADTSSLKPGIGTQGYAILVYEKAAQTFNKRYGGNLTWEEIGAFYDSRKAERILARIQASKTVAQTLGAFKRLKTKYPNRTREEWRKIIKDNPRLILDEDEVIDDAIKKMIRAGISPRTIFDREKKKGNKK